jgi:hypothetical protein
MKKVPIQSHGAYLSGVGIDPHIDIDDPHTDN